jgi:hypothetical protein
MFVCDGRKSAIRAAWRRIGCAMPWRRSMISAHGQHKARPNLISRS